MLYIYCVVFSFLILVLGISISSEKWVLSGDSARTRTPDLASEHFSQAFSNVAKSDEHPECLKIRLKIDKTSKRSNDEQIYCCNYSAIACQRTFIKIKVYWCSLLIEIRLFTS